MVESCLRPSTSSVTAATATTVVMSVPELVMNALLPLMTHSSVRSSRTARVRAPPASEPKPGSVRPNAAKDSPASNGGSQRRFCSSLPYRKIGIAPRQTPASRVIATLESTRASSSIATHRATVVPAHAAELLRERQAEQAHLAHLPDDLVREGVLLVVLGDDRRDHLVGELRDGLAQCLLLLVEHVGSSRFTPPEPRLDRRSYVKRG